MAKIPLYEGKQPLTAKAPSVRRDPGVAGQLGRDIAGAGSAILQASQTIQKAYDFQQVETARVKAFEGTNALIQKAIEDGENTGDLTAYESGLQELRGKASEGITNRSTKEKFQLSFDLQAAQARTKIKSIFWTRMKAKGIASMDRVNIEITSEYAETGDPSYLEAIKLNIDSYVKQGFIKADTAQTLKTNAVLKAKEDRFLYDLENNTGKVESNLESNAYGFDVKKLKDANTVWNTEKHRIYNQNEIDLDQLKFDEELNEAIVNKYVQEGKIEPATGSRYLADLRAIDASNPDSFEMVSFTERATEIARLGKRWNNWVRNPQEAALRFAEATLLRRDVMDARSKKRLSKKEAQNILGEMKGAFTNYEPYVDGILKLKDFTEVNFSPAQRDTVKKQLYSSFMELVKNGEDPTKAINLSQATLYPQYKFEDLVATSKETRYTIQEVVDLLEKKAKK